MKPTISVILPNYNDGHHLEGKIASLQSTDYPITEIVIINDGSTDDSLEIIKRLMERDPRILLLVNEVNRGVIFSANRGVEAATGEYVIITSANDMIVPELIDKSMGLLARYPQAGISFTDYAVVTPDGQVSINRHRFSDIPCYFAPDELSDRIRGFSLPFFIPVGSSIMKRAALLEAGNHREELKWHCDWFASLVVAFRCGACYIPEPLFTIHDDPASYSSRGMRNRKARREVFTALFSAINDDPQYVDIRRYLIQPAVLGIFGFTLANEMILRPRYWGYLVKTLLDRTYNAGHNLSHQLRSRIPAPIRKRIASLLGRRKA